MKCPFIGSASERRWPCGVAQHGTGQPRRKSGSHVVPYPQAGQTKMLAATGEYARALDHVRNPAEVGPAANSPGSLPAHARGTRNCESRFRDVREMPPAGRGEDVRFNVLSRHLTLRAGQK